MKMKIAFAAIALTAICSAFATKTVKVGTDYYVTAIDGDQLTITTSPRICSNGSDACHFNTELQPNGDKFSLTTLQQNSVQIDNGALPQ